MSTVEIYTDGACRGNPGPGGWAAFLSVDGREKEIAGAEALTAMQSTQTQVTGYLNNTQTVSAKLTQGTYDRLVAELEDLTTRGRVEIARDIEAARADGAATTVKPPGAACASPVVSSAAIPAGAATAIRTPCGEGA